MGYFFICLYWFLINCMVIKNVCIITTCGALRWLYATILGPLWKYCMTGNMVYFLIIECKILIHPLDQVC